jgi:uncharacterized protein YkwD
MRTRNLVGAVVVLLAAAAGLVAETVAPTCHVEENLLKLTNNQRRAYGLPPLRVDPRLVDSARKHARWMASRHALVHTSQPVAENIAMGQRGTRQAIESWMSSSGHRANILNAGHRRIGVAWAAASNGTFYWCQQFGP